jgi:hypothetical protein
MQYQQKVHEGKRGLSVDSIIAIQDPTSLPDDIDVLKRMKLNLIDDRHRHVKKSENNQQMLHIAPIPPAKKNQQNTFTDQPHQRNPKVVTSSQRIGRYCRTIYRTI